MNGLWYKKDGDFELRVYTNAIWIGNTDDQKSTSGGTYFLGERLVKWISKKRSCISHSNIKDEYVDIAINCSNII